MNKVFRFLEHPLFCVSPPEQYLITSNWAKYPQRQMNVQNFICEKPHRAYETTQQVSVSWDLPSQNIVDLFWVHLNAIGVDNPSQ